MEALVPEETSREERSRRNASEEVLGALEYRLCGSPCLCSLFPKTLILLVIGRGCGAVDNVVAVEESNASNQVGKHGLGELGIIFRLERCLWFQNLLESLRERERSSLEFFGDSLRYNPVRPMILR